MAQQHTFSDNINNNDSLAKRMLIGAGIAFLLISVFLLGVDQPAPHWPKLWYIRPLLIVPGAGAIGGAFSYYVSRQLNQNGWQRAFAILLSLMVYIIGLWLGSVLGLVGTLWN